jgi:predicted MPP superfamily phosphohydrolase
MSETVVKVAALGDIHVNETNRSEMRDLLIDIGQTADLLVLCGDLTNRGLPSEAAILAEDLVHCPVPAVAVLGNHDVESGQENEVVKILREGGITMLDDEPYETRGIGFAG